MAEGPSPRLNPLDDPTTMLGARSRYYQRRLGELMGARGQQAQQAAVQELLELPTQPGGMFVNQAGQYRGAGGGKSGALFGALGTAMGGDPLSAAISAPIGLTAGAVANPLVTAATQGLIAGPGPAKALGMGLRFAVPALVGGGVQQAAAAGVQQVRGVTPQGQPTPQATTAGERPTGPAISIPTPFGEIPVTPAAAEEQTRRRDLDYAVQQATRMGQAGLALDKEMLQFQMQQELQMQKAQLPLIERLQRSQLVNQQALLASQTSAYQTLGRQATMGALAREGQQERGATFRTAISQSPYAGAVMQAPSISF